MWPVDSLNNVLDDEDYIHYVIIKVFFFLIIKNKCKRNKFLLGSICHKLDLIIHIMKLVNVFVCFDSK